MSNPDRGVLGLVHRHFQTERIVPRCSTCGSKPGGIFCNLDRFRLRELGQYLQMRAYPAGAFVFMERDEPLVAYCVCSGRIKLSSSSPDGRAVIVSIAACGDVLGVRPLLLGRPHDLTAITLEAAELCLISKEDFLAFLQQNGDASLLLAQKLSAELDEAYRKVSGAALKPVAERLAELLLALCQTHGEITPAGIWLRTNLCQEELAELLGISRRSLNRALAQLRSEGLIESGRRSLRVPDRSALRNWLTAHATL